MFQQKFGSGCIPGAWVSVSLMLFLLLALAACGQSPGISSGSSGGSNGPAVTASSPTGQATPTPHSNPTPAATHPGASLKNGTGCLLVQTAGAPPQSPAVRLSARQNQQTAHLH